MFGDNRVRNCKVWNISFQGLETQESMGSKIDASLLIQWGQALSFGWSLAALSHECLPRQGRETQKAQRVKR